MAHLKIAHLAIEEASTEEDQDVEMAHLEDDCAIIFTIHLQYRKS